LPSDFFTSSDLEPLPTPKYGGLKDLWPKMSKQRT
jgi:hypothetical protein